MDAGVAIRDVFYAGAPMQLHPAALCGASVRHIN
jgi:hypothetical protein